MKENLGGRKLDKTEIDERSYVALLNYKVDIND